MKFNTLILIVSTLSCTLEARKYSVLDFVISKNCSEVYTTLIPKYVPYEEVYYTRNWLGLKKKKNVRVNYKLENHVSYQTRGTCCNGYKNFGINSCIPVCSQDCRANSICSAPELCRCNEGYSMDHTTNTCKPLCLNECINGFCISPNLCACNDGYRMRPDGFTCEPICYNCTNFEYCVEPHVCRCINGYTRDSIERIDSSTVTMCHAVCERECVNADCVEPDRCECHEGYADHDNDAFTCEPVCRYGCKYGVCTNPNTCSCFPGHALRSNNSNICDPVCIEKCVNAECIAPDVCSCYDGYIPDGPDTSHICQPYCSNVCTHGKCTAPEECTCNEGYSWNRDNKSCEPICTETCLNGICTGPETCECFDGYQLSQANISTCEPICQEPCVHGNCTAPNECTCEDGYENKDNSNSKCIAVCECENGSCSDESSTCENCAEGYKLTLNGNSTICTPHCDGGCPHGYCVEPQKCECDEYYLSENDTSGNPLLCLHACNGDCRHGKCLVDKRLCECFHGWTGTYCDEPTACAILIMDSDPIYTLFNKSSISDDTFENASITENPWMGPTCLDKCRLSVYNRTLCIEEFGEDHSNATCFIDINSPCNTYMIVMPNTYESQVSMITIVASTVLSILCVAAVICIGMFIGKRKRDRLLESSRSELQMKQEDACLIENDADAISL